MENLTSIQDHSDWLHNLPLMTMSQRWDLHRQRVNFGKQPLEIWQFVPCKLVDGVWVVLEFPILKGIPRNASFNAKYQNDCFEYKEAKKLCLFKGFECYVNNQIMSDDVIINIINSNLYFEMVFEDKLPKSLGRLSTIEDLIQCNTKLTSTAQKQINN
jgi:hypothetical protein